MFMKPLLIALVVADEQAIAKQRLNEAFSKYSKLKEEIRSTEASLAAASQPLSTTGTQEAPGSPGRALEEMNKAQAAEVGGGIVTKLRQTLSKQLEQKRALQRTIERCKAEVNPLLLISSPAIRCKWRLQK